MTKNDNCAGGDCAPFGQPPWRRLRSLFLSFCSCPRRSPAWGAVSAAVVCLFVLFRGRPRWAHPAVGSWLALGARAVAFWLFSVPPRPSRRFVVPPAAARRPFLFSQGIKEMAALSERAPKPSETPACKKGASGRRAGTPVPLSESVSARLQPLRTFFRQAVPL